jgi:uncharacterized paraquat-inducible protein A
MIITCPDCSTIQSIPDLRAGSRLLCCRGDKVPERTADRSLDAMGVERSSRLGSGVIALWREGWPLLWSVHRRSGTRLKRKTRVYRFIEEIGRWSNIDVFTIVTFLLIMQLGGFVSMRAGTGAPALLAVIVLTMVAVRLFDPCLLWDSARKAA